MDEQVRRVLAEEFRGIARILRHAEPPETYRAVAHAAVRIVDGCEHAAVSVNNNGRVHTAAATDDIARRMDALQIEAGDGPCLDVLTTPKWERHLDLDAAHPPTTFHRRLREETPIRSMLAFRLLDEDRKIGALNIGATRAHAFDDAAAVEGAILAAFSSAAVIASRSRQRERELEQGLATSREIGTAVGIVAASYDVAPDQAFDVLVHASRNANRKLRDVAAEVVAAAKARREGEPG